MMLLALNACIWQPPDGEILSEQEADDAINPLSTRVEAIESQLAALATLEDISSVRADLDAAVASLEDEVALLETEVADLQRVVVPVGGVIDWYRPNSGVPVPTGWVLLDGSDTCGSGEFLGRALPDMRGKFVRGVEEQQDVGAVGADGSDIHGHAVDITHGHGISVELGGEHDHRWASWDAEDLQWIAGEGKEIFRYTDGMDSEGTGYYPLTEQDESATQDYDTSIDGLHAHDAFVFDYVGVAVTDLASNVPEYVGFLKIMRCY